MITLNFDRPPEYESLGDLLDDLESMVFEIKHGYSSSSMDNSLNNVFWEVEGTTEEDWEDVEDDDYR